MKTRKKELDVDFIGGSGPLTKEEEKRISDIIRSRKSKQKVTAKKSKTKLTSKKKVTA
jgi:predicted polyphosphate/ATP-dependent NAD kinase